MAKGSNQRHVVPNPNGGWDVKAPGAKRASGRHDSQASAINQARQVTHNSGGGELVIHGRNGQIRAKDTIPPAKDPFPPAG